MALYDGELDPELDGVTHLNVYSKGKVRLGRFLSNFAHTPLDIGEDGHFESIEGYWYWLKTGDDRLRSLHGYQAKQLGKKLPLLKPGVDFGGYLEFEAKIKAAITAKLKAYPSALKELRETTLPLAHYYVFGVGGVKDAGYKWILEHIDSLRNKPEDQMEPIPVNLSRHECDVYIGRAGKGHDGYFGNPVAMGKKCPECSRIHRTRGETLPCYELYARRRMAGDPEFVSRIKALGGKKLGCFCKPGPCHGDVLVKFWKELNQ